VNGRDENGRFVKGNQISKGNKGGTGRPAKAREERYLEIAKSTVSFAQWRKIIKRAAEDAEKGDTAARKFLADYLLGPPTQSHDIRTMGQVEIQVTYSDAAKR